MASLDLRRITRGQLVRLGVRRNKPWLIAGLFFVAFGVLLSATPWGMYLRDARIAESGARADATVGDLNWRANDDGGYEGDVAYSFTTTNGAEIEGRELNISRETFDLLDSGDMIRVAYDPASPTDNFPLDPEKGIIGGSWQIWSATLVSSFGLLPIAFGGLILWGLFFRLPGSWEFVLVHGQTTEGVVVGHRQHTDGEDSSLVMLEYSFRDKFGQMQTETTQYVPERLAAEWPAGATGQVRYDPRTNKSVWLGNGDLTFFR